MLTFAWPQTVLLLPLPFLVRALLRPATETGGSVLYVPFFSLLKRLPAGSAAFARLKDRRLLLLWLGWGLLILAGMRPMKLGPPLPIPHVGRDIMLAVDISGSMSTMDFTAGDRYIPRITAVKAVAGDFIEQRKGDRVGLMLFGSRPYAVSPFTPDRAAVRRLLEDATLGLAGKKTALGDAMGLMTKIAERDPDKEKILVLLTDGRNTAGSLEPMEAARLAQEAGVRIHTIGAASGKREVSSMFGRHIIVPNAQPDEDMLHRIATLTGGVYFRARDTDELVKVYRNINKIEPVADKAEVFRTRRDLFFWPLALALIPILIALRLGTGIPATGRHG